MDFVENATNVSRPSLFCLGFRGEERARGEEFDVAVRALRDKLATKDQVFLAGCIINCVMQELAIGSSFFALDLQRAGARLPLSDSFTFTLPHSRSLCVAYVVNMFQVMRTLNKCFPEPCWTMDNGLLELKDLCSVVIGSVVLLVDPIKCLVEDDCVSL